MVYQTSNFMKLIFFNIFKILSLNVFIFFQNPLSFATQDSAFSDNSAEELNLIIKSDVHGSSEAIKNAISQIKHEEVKPKIILSDIGMVTETDVTLAKASNAVLIAFNVKPSKEMQHSN